AEAGVRRATSSHRPDCPVLIRLRFGIRGISDVRLDAEFAGFANETPHVGRADEGFRRNAPGPEALAAKLTLFRERDSPAHFGCGARGLHTGGPAADHNEIIPIHRPPPPRRR